MCKIPTRVRLLLLCRRSTLQMYGFAEADNPYDVYVMSSLLKWLEQLAPVSQARLDRLNKDELLGALQEVFITRQGFGAQTLQVRYAMSHASITTTSSSSSIVKLPTKVDGSMAMYLECMFTLARQ
jgi:hypothetical protein